MRIFGRQAFYPLYRRYETQSAAFEELFGELAGVWNELVEIVEEESQVATANRLEAPGILAVEPMPSTFRTFLLLSRPLSARDPSPARSGRGDGSVGDGWTVTC